MGDEREKDGLAGDKVVEAGRGRGKYYVMEAGGGGGGVQISRWEAEPNQTLLSRNSRTELRKDQ